MQPGDDVSSDTDTRITVYDTRVMGGKNRRTRSVRTCSNDDGPTRMKRSVGTAKIAAGDVSERLRVH